MNYCILDESNRIANIIVADDPSFAESIDVVPAYDGCIIGDEYAPPVEPIEPTTEERVATLEKNEKLNAAKLQAQNDRQEFLEDCIAEMAAIVYV